MAIAEAFCRNRALPALATSLRVSPFTLHARGIQRGLVAVYARQELVMPNVPFDERAGVHLEFALCPYDSPTPALEIGTAPEPKEFP